MQTMKPRCTPLDNCGLNAFKFAGFQWPRYVATLPKGSQAERLENYKKPVTGPYYHAPKLVGRDHGRGFYLDDAGMPGLRWQWCDEVQDVNIRHTGWHCDEFQGDKIRGLVFTLPHGRGFLAGWSMGERMSSAIEYGVYETAAQAAYAADSIAEDAAEKQREYEEQQRQDEGEDE